MNTIKDTIKSSFVYEGQEYFNIANAAKYVGMTDSGFRRHMRTIEEENEITFPLTTRPTSTKKGREMYINKKILDILYRPVLKGKEQEWLEKLKQAIEQEIKTHKF